MWIVLQFCSIVKINAGFRTNGDVEKSRFYEQFALQIAEVQDLKRREMTQDRR